MLTRGTSTCAYDASDEMLAEGPNTQTYDANGSTSGTTIPGEGAYSHSYDDYENRVTGITLGRAGQAYPNATTASFRYNGDGLRVRVREPDSAEEDYFLYDGVRPYMRMESAQGLPRAVYVSEGGTYYSPIVTLRTANANWTYLRDGMESVRKILNDSQTTTDAYTFEAFGNPTGQAGTTVNPFRYVGALGYYWFDFAHHGRDRTTSLRLLGARYYGPSPRRFWTQDPARQGTNWYAYVANDPVNVVDPTGLTGEGCGSDLPSARNAVRGACSIFESHRRRACAWACGVTGAAFNCMRSWCGNPQYRCAAPGHPGCCPRGGGATLGFSLCTEGSGAFVFCPASFAGGGLSGRTETVWHEVLHYCGRCSEQFHPEIWRMTDCLASCLD